MLHSETSSFEKLRSEYIFPLTHLFYKLVANFTTWNSKCGKLPTSHSKYVQIFVFRVV